MVERPNHLARMSRHPPEAMAPATTGTTKSSRTEESKIEVTKVETSNNNRQEAKTKDRANSPTKEAVRGPETRAQAAIIVSEAPPPVVSKDRKIKTVAATIQIIPSSRLIIIVAGTTQKIKETTIRGSKTSNS